MRYKTFVAIAGLIAVGAVSGIGQAAVPCDMVEAEWPYCDGGENCTREIVFNGPCENGGMTYQCHWYGAGCTEHYSTPQPCDCSPTLDPNWTCDCLLSGTPISLADGTTKPVEDIQPGDKVMAYDEKTKKIVSSFVVSVHDPYRVKSYLVINDRVRVTENHPFLSDGKWVAAGDLEIGSWLTAADGLNETMASRNVVTEDAMVYNFQVDIGTYIAGGFVVHNKEDCEYVTQYYP